jgi:hypothetical protein
MWMAVLLAASPIVLLSGTFPDEVPSGRTIEGWERLSGHSEHKGNRISYELLVDPARYALYTITRYRVHRVDKEQADDEILIWHSQPGARPMKPMLCFIRVPRQHLGIVKSWAWEPVLHNTEPYRQAMSIATQVYMIHRARERALEEAAK